MDAVQRAVVEAPAKINLFLEITGRRDDGYHWIDAVIQAVGLSDLLLIGRKKEPGVRVTCSLPALDGERNLAHRAAAAFLCAIGRSEDGIHIHIDKRIPCEAGLGGGSSDAAAVLLGLHSLYCGALAPEKLPLLALALGADVPFFLQGGAARARGVGEIFNALPALPDCFLLIAKPASGVCTAGAYAQYDQQQHPCTRRPDAMLRAFETGDLHAAGSAAYNVFEALAQSGETARIKAVMAEHGALGAVLSGSGSAISGLFAQAAQARACMTALAAVAAECFLAAPLSHGAKILFIN